MADERTYQEAIEREVADAIELAETARSNGGDPYTDVEIPVAKDMAARVENLLELEGVAQRIRELEGEVSREHAALHLAEDIATGELGGLDDPGERVDAAVRTAVALLTEGVVAAPIEGIDRVAIEDASDGSSFVRITYAGPIRSAGGTAQALSVLVADYTRSLLDIAPYRPTDAEIGRTVEEVQLYERETGLQYAPTREEITHIAQHCPIMLDGEPTTEDEVDSYRDIGRIDTNRGRGGMCLVLAEGIAQKADKLARYVDDLDAVDWPWLDTLRTGGESDDETADDVSKEDLVKPKDNYLVDLIAGRPVVAHPSRPGGFRLRYGRARNHGLATAGVHPATMHLLDDFLAPGTQLKTERPGKAAGVVPVDTIEGPVVRLHDGSVRRLDDPEETIELRTGVAEILDIGEYLVNVGEFVENNHRLLPGAYDVRRWRLEMAESGADIQALADDPEVSLTQPSPERAVGWAQRHDAPLHPHYTYLYHDATTAELDYLAEAIDTATRTEDGLLVDADDEIASVLGTLLVPYEATEDGWLIEEWLPLARSLGFDGSLQRQWDSLEGDDPLAAVNEVAPFEIRAKAPTRVGARMGRPEKSEPRELSPAVHCLFPVGAAGGDQRSIAEAAAYRPDANGDVGEIEVELNRRRCLDCGVEGVDPRCPDCGASTALIYVCRDCDIEIEADGSDEHHCPRCGREGTCVQTQALDIGGRFERAFDDLDVHKRHVPMVKGVKGLTSETKAPEPIEKGVLRASHDITVFKDGTSRYDMTDLPVTAVRPSEVGVDAETFRELGYETDIDGDELRYDDQVVELHYQDLILSHDAAEYLYRTSQFVDDLLTDYYGLEPFYELSGPEDLVGELVLGLAPHTSAAVTGRVVGFTSAAVGYAHPFFHAAKRRNCFHPETSISIIDDDGEARTTSIADFVESRLDSPREDDFGVLIQEVDETVEVPSINNSGRAVQQPVEEVSKHPAPTHLISVETRGGNSITVTPDHQMLVWEDGLERTSASELECGDWIPLSSVSELSTEEALIELVDGGRPRVDSVASVDIVESDVEFTYCLSVAETHALEANGLMTGQCDGDEDCVMLMMDGLLNFSRSYLPSNRGGRMDAPLVLSTRIDPAEIDDESHNIETVSTYPLELYEAADAYADPDTLDIALAGDAIGPDTTPRFGHTDDPSDLSAGPDLSAYKTLESMEEKLTAQLELARKLRAVDESDVAERVIEGHYLPDLLGNLRAFASQETRCRDCGKKYRRVPLSGSCYECGGTVSLTVYQGMVNKYLEPAIDIAEQYEVRSYTRQRLDVLEKTLESLFEDDTDKQAGIADFM